MDVVLEVVVEEDVVGVNGKENLMLHFDCIKYNPHFICTEYSTNWVEEKYSVKLDHFADIYTSKRQPINMLFKCHFTCCNIII